MTESGQILGTAGYMSPEQAAGKSRLVGPASDVYSLVVLSLPIMAWYQVMTIVDGVQDARGGALPELIFDLRTYPSFLVTPILKSRFTNESDAHRKRSLAFALAAFGTVNADYLVAQVEGVGEGDTGNLLNALAADREASLKILGAEAVKSESEKNWRHKSQLAILALHLGDSALAVDMCQIKNRPDPTQRTYFIDEFPKWHFHTKALTEVVKSSEDQFLNQLLFQHSPVHVPSFGSSIVVADLVCVPGRQPDRDKSGWSHSGDSRAIRIKLVMKRHPGRCKPRLNFNRRKTASGH